MTKKNTTKILEILIAFVCYVAIYYITKQILLTTLLLFIPVVYIGAKNGFFVGTLFFIVTSLATYLLDGEAALLLALMVLPFLCIMVPAFLKKWTAWTALIAACAAAAISVGIYLGYLYMASQGEVMQYLLDALQNKMKSSNELTAMLYSMLQVNELAYSTSLLQVSITEMRAFLLEPTIWADVKNMVYQLAPQLAISYTVYGGVIGFFGVRGLLKVIGSEVVRVPSVRRLAIPKTQGYYMLATMLLAFMPGLFGIASLETAANLILSLFTSIFAIQGFSVVCFFLGLRIKSTGGQVVLALLIYTFVPSLVLLVGMLEQFVRIRDRFTIIKFQK